MANTSDPDHPEWHHHRMPGPHSPIITASWREHIVSCLTSGWRYPSESPLWTGSTRAKRLSGLLCRSGGSAVQMRSSCPPWVFIPTVAYVTFTVMGCSEYYSVLQLTSRFESVTEKRCTSMRHKGTDNGMESARHSVSILLMYILPLVLHSFVSLALFTRACHLTWVYF